MLASLRHGHNSLARLAARPVILHVRSKVTTSKTKAAKPKTEATKPKAKRARSKPAKEPTDDSIAKTKPTSPMLAVTSDIARKLNLTGVWKKRQGGGKMATAIEPRRVNIVSEGLCGKPFKASQLGLVI